MNQLARKTPGNPIHVVYSADANYAPYAGISMASVLCRFPWDWRDIHFHVLADEFNPRDAARMKATVGFTEVSIYDMKRYFERDLNFLRRQPKYLTRAAYGRIFVGEVLPPTVKRVIYLDCDTVALADISELWTLTQETAILAACPDTGSGVEAQKRAIGMSPESTYYNSGVMVMNLAAWRARNIGDKLIELAQTIPNCRTWDQDPLNLLLASEVTPLPRIWNIQLGGEPLPADARIAHFSGRTKPWQLRYKGPAPEVFRQAKRASLWCYMLPELGIRRTVRRLQRSLAKRHRHS